MNLRKLRLIVLLFLAAGFATNVQGSGNEPRKAANPTKPATTMPATSRPSVSLEKLFVASVKINNRRLFHVLMELSQRTGIALVFVDMMPEPGARQDERLIRQPSIKEPTPVVDVLRKISIACGGLRWKSDQGALIVSVLGVKAVTDNPLEKFLKPLVFKGSLEEFWRRIVSEVPELYSCTSWSPRVASKRVVFETKKRVTVMTAMAMMASKYGVRWYVKLEKKLREIPCVIETVGKPDTKQRTTMRARTYVSCGLGSVTRTILPIAPLNSGIKTPESSPSQGSVEGSRYPTSKAAE